MTGMNTQSSETAAGQSPDQSAMSKSRVLEADKSCSVPVMFLLTWALAWLVGGGILAVVSSIKLHGPGFLAGSAWLTYGRVQPASIHALLYGFGFQAAIAVGLWMIARLGQAELMGRKGILLGGAFWNLGVCLGVFGILGGAGTGHPMLEMPGFVSPLLLVSYSLMGVWALITLHFRQVRSLYVSQWYLLAALFWFPWIFIAAQSSLVFHPVRGALQFVISSWYGHAVVALWLVPVALAVLFYFIPKLLGRPLHSKHLATFGFWTMALFAGWGGVQAGAPVPRWISSVCIVGGGLMLLPLIAVGMNWWFTARGAKPAQGDFVWGFIRFAAVAFFAAMLLDIGGRTRVIGEVTDLTVFSSGVYALYFYGVFGMSIAGAVYYLVPKITQTEWPSAQLIRWHYLGSMVGTVLITAALVVGGVIQGLRLNNADIAFVDALAKTVPFLGLSTLGGLILVAANVAFLLNLVRLLTVCCRCCCCLPWNGTANGNKAAAVGANL